MEISLFVIVPCRQVSGDKFLFEINQNRVFSISIKGVEILLLTHGV